MDKLKFRIGDIVTYKNYRLKIVGIDGRAECVLGYLCVSADDDTVPPDWDGRVIGDFDMSMCTEFQISAEGKYGIWPFRNELLELVSTPIVTEGEEKPVIEVRRFKSGAIRSDDRGREKPSFVSPYAIKFLAEHFSANAAFFNGNDSGKNYMKGILPEDIQDSLERHVLDFKFAMLPGKNDRNAVKKSFVEIMANCMMGLHQIGLEEDGLYKEVYEKTEYINREEAYDK